MRIKPKQKKKNEKIIQSQLHKIFSLCSIHKDINTHEPHYKTATAIEYKSNLHITQKNTSQRSHSISLFENLSALPINILNLIYVFILLNFSFIYSFSFEVISSQFSFVFCVLCVFSFFHSRLHDFYIYIFLFYN